MYAGVYYTSAEKQSMLLNAGSYSFFIFILLCNEQSRQTREINNGEVEQKYCKRIQ